MLTEKDYCDYETCVALKELGYNRGAYAYYFPNHKEDLVFNTHQMRGCSINEMLKGYNTYPKDVMGHELIDAPTLYEAQKWLREEKGVVVLVSYDKVYKTEEIVYGFVIATKDEDIWFDDKSFDSYEEALSEGIRTAVKLLKEKKNDK